MVSFSKIACALAFVCLSQQTLAAGPTKQNGAAPSPNTNSSPAPNGCTGDNCGGGATDTGDNGGASPAPGETGGSTDGGAPGTPGATDNGGGGGNQPNDENNNNGGNNNNNNNGTQPATGSVIGDPHLRSLDGVTFEFMKQGTFSLVDTPAGLKVQSLMTACGDDKKSSCTIATAISYHGSVVRFLENKGKITVAKGSPKVGALTVHKAGDTYRVHINDDSNSYIDLNVADWHGEGFLDTTCVLSAKTKKGNKGILGNGDGNKKNDVTDENKLAKQFIIKGDNLLTCKDCTKLAGAFKAVKWQKKNEWSQQGYNVVDPAKIPVQTASVSKKKRTLRAAGSPAKQTASTPFDESKVEPLCMKTLSEIPHCDKLVKLKAFYIDSVCVKDTKLTKDLNNIDHAKLAYLRQCRRLIDIELSSGGSADSIKQKRKELTFGTTEVCPKNCNKNGTCMLSGCACNKGFTGYACTTKLW